MADVLGASYGQLYGVKRWTVCEVHGVFLPSEGASSATVVDNPNQTCSSFDMTPGSVLYMPKGTAHSPATLDTPSLHLTLALENTASWGYFLQCLLLEPDVQTLDHNVEAVASLGDLISLPYSWFSSRPPSVKRKDVLMRLLSDSKVDHWQLRATFPLWALAQSHTMGNGTASCGTPGLGGWVCGA